MKRWVVLRRSSQTLFLLLFVYVLWSTTYPLKGPIPPEILFKINPLIIFFTSASERVILPGIVSSIIMLIATLIFGRFFCGWMCPLGATIDLFGSFKRKGRKQDDLLNRKLRKPKFFILVVISVFALAGVQLAWVMDPMVIMARFVSLNLIPSTTLLIDKAFGAAVQNLNTNHPLYDFYRSLKSSILGTNPYYFSHSVIILIFTLSVFATTVFVKRFWCRALCPLGALYSVTAKFSLLTRTIKECKAYEKCKSQCRMGAIKDDLSYSKGECILCMDCVYDCPENVTRFSWPVSKNKDVKDSGAGDRILRRDFMILLSSSFFALGFKWRRGWGYKSPTVIRPPAALKENELINRCIRCGNCMKVCITNGLQPVMFQSGLAGIWTPQLLPEIGYCEYNCTLCGNVCPTGAIKRVNLEEKHATRLGLAAIDRSTCIAWAQNQSCIVCQEHCPVPEKAIKLIEEGGGNIIVPKPIVDKTLCVGCGICQNKCPVSPTRAIRVQPL